MIIFNMTVAIDNQQATFAVDCTSKRIGLYSAIVLQYWTTR